MPPISLTSRESLTEKFHALLDECDTVTDNALFGHNPRQHKPSMTSKHFSSYKDGHASEKSSKKNYKNESNNPKPTTHLNATIVKKTTIADIKERRNSMPTAPPNSTSSNSERMRSGSGVSVRCLRNGIAASCRNLRWCMRLRR